MSGPKLVCAHGKTKCKFCGTSTKSEVQRAWENLATKSCIKCGMPIKTKAGTCKKCRDAAKGAS